MSSFTRKEIGGYFEFEKLTGEGYHKKSVGFNLARTALVAYCREMGYNTIHLPVFLCGSVKRFLELHCITVSLYNIGTDFLPIDLVIDDDDLLMIVNYFNFISDADIASYNEKYNVIVDNTQAYFRDFDFAVPSIYNCRKYFGVPDGAYISELEIDESKYGRDTSMGRFDHLIGRFSSKASEYYREFKTVDESFENSKVMLISKITENILSAVDYDSVKKSRVENYKYLDSKLSEYNLIQNDVKGVPFCYPFLIKNGCELRKYLISRNVYVPCYWPDVLEFDSSSDLEKNFAQNIVHIPIDQRYEINDMDAILQIVFDFLEGVV